MVEINVRANRKHNASLSRNWLSNPRTRYDVRALSDNNGLAEIIRGQLFEYTRIIWEQLDGHPPLRCLSGHHLDFRNHQLSSIRWSCCNGVRVLVTQIEPKRNASLSAAAAEKEQRQTSYQREL